MVYHRGLYILFLVGLINATDILEPGSVLVLFPSEDAFFTEWDFKTCEGCKLSLQCTFLTELCHEARVFYIVDGELKEFCAKDLPKFENIILRTSYSNNMRIIIQNSEVKKKSYCEIQATRSYLNDPEEPTDSAEYISKNELSRQNSHCQCGWGNKVSQRIVNGDEADINEFPFVVAIKIYLRKDNYTLCGGSIISSKAILSAAHCFVDWHVNHNFTVLVGEHDLDIDYETSVTREMKVSQVMCHSNYIGNPITNDICILILQESIEFNDRIGPVCLPSNHDDLVGSYIKVMGWGMQADEVKCGTSSSVLRKVNLKVVHKDVCKALYFDKAESILCTYSRDKDSCQGDSGGPLVTVNFRKLFVQIALVSYGNECASSDATVNTDIRYHMDWIKHIIEDQNAGQLCY